MRLIRTTGSLLLAVACVLGCESDPAKVSKDQVADIRTDSQSLRIGMTKKEALGTFDRGNKVMLGTTAIGDASVEEWKVEAYHDDDWAKQRDLFVTFLYFVNGRLVDVSDKRLAPRDNPDLVDRWTGG